MHIKYLDNRPCADIGKAVVRMDWEEHPRERNIAVLCQLLLYPLLPKNRSWTSAAVRQAGDSCGWEISEMGTKRTAETFFCLLCCQTIILFYRNGFSYFQYQNYWKTQLNPNTMELEENEKKQESRIVWFFSFHMRKHYIRGTLMVRGKISVHPLFPLQNLPLGKGRSLNTL